ncbi:MAG: LacI family transcriptional regulator [Sphingomonadales bacterium]|nr:LacI family transcriptional regulator [Sphingomonadales bacterium]
MEQTAIRGNRRSTMVDVAREAGVSLKTVSRVLNKESYVREETKTAVLDAAARLDYKLNQAARTLRAGTTQIVALLVNNPSRSYLENVHFGALAKCHELSMQLVLDECPNGVSDVRRILKSLSPVGLIVTPPLCDDPEVIELLEEQGCTYVLVAPVDPASTKYSVNMDDMAAAKEITDYLLKLGHSRIGYIRGHPDHGASVKRYAGYCDALRGQGIEPDPALIRQGYFDYASGLECAESLLNMDEPPTAIFASNDDMAAAIIAAAYRRNISVPGQLSVVGFDDTPIAGIISPHLTTIRQPIADLAANAVQLLSENIAQSFSSEQGETTIFLQHALIERDSAGVPAA